MLIGSIIPNYAYAKLIRDAYSNFYPNNYIFSDVLVLFLINKRTVFF